MEYEQHKQSPWERHCEIEKVKSIQAFKAEMDNLAEIEWTEHYYGLDRGYLERPSDYSLGIDGEDRAEYRGYWDDASDYDLPWMEFTPRIDWSEIPF